MEGVPWWVVGSLFFFYGENVSNFWRNYPFFSKKNRQNSPLFLGSVSPVMAKSV